MPSSLGTRLITSRPSGFVRRKRDRDRARTFDQRLDMAIVSGLFIAVMDKRHKVTTTIAFDQALVKDRMKMIISNG